MKVNLNTITKKNLWEEKGINLPKFDVKKMINESEINPEWVHFGAGNIFRGFIARINQTLLNKGLTKTGIIACDTFDYEIIEKIYTPFDNLTFLVSLASDGKTKKEIIAGVSKSYRVATQFPDYKKMIEIFEKENLKVVSFTITEKGYALKNPQGEFLKSIQNDIENGPEKPCHVISIVTALLLKRFLKGKYKISLCSMDNCSCNGEKLQNSVFEIAKQWKDKGFVSDDFLQYLHNENSVAFPWSMIDKITPRPSKIIENELFELGIEDMSPIVTEKNTFIAPYVNAEIPEYLVIEDKFPNGRPPFEEAGVFVTNRETVNKAETMKVTTCLNPLHTALAVFGCILGYTRIFEEMKDLELKKLVEKIGLDEGMKVVVDPEIISPREFIDEVINVRFPNPFVPDEPQRIATDTSQKVGIRFGETIKSYIKNDKLDVHNLTFIPLAIAGWLRYLLAVDDNGNAFELSPDPLLSELKETLKDVELSGKYNGEIREIIKNKNIFGLDLMECELGEKIEEMFIKMIAGEGAVRATLKEYLQ